MLANSASAVLVWKMPDLTPAASPHHASLNLVLADTSRVTHKL